MLKELYSNSVVWGWFAIIPNVKELLTQIIKQLYGVDVVPILTRPEPEFGDLATNVALQIAKSLGRNPREIAEEVANEIRKEDSFELVEVAGPGFINIRLSGAALMKQAMESEYIADESLRYVIEYSCPNAFKELHTGHLYQTIAGDVIARLVERAGHSVNRVSFGGDVGLHVAKCLWGMIDALGGEHPEKLNEIDKDPFVRAAWISAAYVSGAGSYEQDESAKVAINELNKTIYSWHDSDEQETPLAQIYWTTRQWSFDYFAAFYEAIDVDLMHYYPESQTMKPGLEVVNKQLVAGNLKESEGAVVFEGDESKHLHTRVFITSAGLPTYETKDIGVIWLQKQDYDFEQRVLITGNDQKEYMRVVFAAAETFDPALEGRMTHITNGTVRFADGSKMSSRLGNVTRGVDVIDTVREKVREMVADQSLVEVVTLGAVKYAFLKYRLGGDISFDIDETVSLQGNSGPYLQYAHARARSILSKAVKEPGEVGEMNDDERALVYKLGEYAEILERATAELAPHHIGNYLYELAQEFNRFYERNRVIGDERESVRLSLVGMYADRLKSGLELLGIIAPERL